MFFPVETAPDRLMPAAQQAVAPDRVHIRREGGVAAPQSANFLPAAPDAHRKPGQIRRAERGRFTDNGAAVSRWLN